MADKTLWGRMTSVFSWNDLVGCSFLMMLLAALLAASDLSGGGTEAPLSWIAVTVLFIVSFLAFAFARLQIAWNESLQSAVGDSSKVSGNFQEQFAYLVLALSALCIVAFENGASSSVWPWEIDFSQPWQIGLFCCALASSFLPLLFALQRHDRLIRDGAYLDEIDGDHISDGSIWISVLVLLLLAGLAWAAGKRLIDLDGWYGPAVMGGVVMMFLFFIFTPSFLRMRAGGTEDRSYAAAGLAISVGKVASWVDTWFAVRLAPLTGATQTGKLPPHVFLLAVFIPLTVMGYALSNGWGLVPIGIAFLLAIALGRRWAWVESDRETAMRIQKTRGRGIKIGFRNDLRDEALLGYAFLFVLVPLALRQIQMIAAPFEFETGAAATSATLTDWAAFFGTELAKAVPIVDWADIYGLENDAAIQAKSEPARHLVFFSRIMVDAIIIAALLQAWSIMQRNKSQRTLFNNGQLDMLDPFAERALFARGVDPNGEVTEQLRMIFVDRISAAKNLGLSQRPYNQLRLNEIVEEQDPDYPELKIVADYLVEKFGLLAGSTSSRITQLRDRWDASTENHWNCPSWVRNQRLDFEKLMDEVQDERRRNVSWTAFSSQQCVDLSALLARVARRQEFVNAKDASFELLADVNPNMSPYPAIVTLSARLFDEDDIPLELFNAIGTNFADWNFSKEPLQERRAAVATAIGRIFTDSKTPVPSKKLCQIVLQWVKDNDSKKPSAEAAKALDQKSSIPTVLHACRICNNEENE